VIHDYKRNLDLVLHHLKCKTTEPNTKTGDECASLTQLAHEVHCEPNREEGKNADKETRPGHAALR
jgi:hypothetical protein